MKTPVVKEHGQGLIEYLLIIAIIGLLVIAILSPANIQSIKTSVTNLLTLPETAAESQPLAESNPPEESPRQTTNGTVIILVVVAAMTAVILVVYALMHINEPHQKVKKKR
jgi:hypothetical protein